MSTTELKGTVILATDTSAKVGIGPGILVNNVTGYYEGHPKPPNFPLNTLHVSDVGNTTVRIGAFGYPGTAADTSTYGLVRSFHSIVFAGFRDSRQDKIGTKISSINKQTYPGTSLRHIIQSSDMAFFTTPPNTEAIDATVERMRITDAGNVGIGTLDPVAPLHVGTSNSNMFPPGSGAITGAVWWNQATTNTTLFGSGTFAPGGTSVLVNLSIYSADNILTAQSYISNSDRRIKSNIIDVDDDKALRDLRLLKPKTYTYKDVNTRGTEPVYGFIAQEVKEVLNYASSFNKETLPNIYELATFLGDTLTLTFNTADLARDASGALFTKIKVKTKDIRDQYVNIVEVIDAHTIKVDKDLTEWGGQIDASGQVVPGDKIFVYGQEVDDFHTLNKDAIWTVATAALQEVDRQLQAEKQKTTEMQTTITALQTTLALALARLDALEQKP